MKKVIYNTIMFLCIIGFVQGFAAIFGSENTLVGVTVLISMLMLMKEDFTKKPLENFMKLLFINVVSGIFAHISSQNIWIGLILNFITLSSIGYFLSFNLDKTLIVPFGLQYLFLLYSPVSGGAFTNRIVGLISGTILIMLVQFIIHRKNRNIKVKESELVYFEKEAEYYREVKIFDKIYKIHSVRGAYAIRIGFAASITAFIVAYLNLEQGRWMVYTIFSLMELYSENCKVRAKDRLQGTIIGALIIFILFIFIKDNSLRGLIVLLAGYLDIYTTNYRDKMICVTMSVVASVSLTNGTITTIIERVGYVIIGIGIALLVNKFLLQSKIKES